jgi:hypothetical protein
MMMWQTMTSPFFGLFYGLGSFTFDGPAHLAHFSFFLAHFLSGPFWLYSFLSPLFILYYAPAQFIL